MQKIILVAGARPNFMKIAPILRVMEKEYRDRIEPVLVHTGQHYDQNMSESFFQGLGIRMPDYSLDVGSGTHADQTARIMTRFEDVCEKEQPEEALVVGDVNSTIAAGLVAKKLHIGLSHVEAGLRSFDRFMPEEINRLATDAITDLFFTTERQGSENLIREGHNPESIHFVGHVMIDNLFYQLNHLNVRGVGRKAAEIKDKLPQRYLCLTLHRPSNVDEKQVLTGLMQALTEIAREVPVVFPCHPRTRARLEEFGLLGSCRQQGEDWEVDEGILLLEPLAYDDFLYLWKDATAVLTDSGGLQEESTALQIPCLTLRENTERPITLEVGSNQLVGQDPQKLLDAVQNLLAGEGKKGRVPQLWDGRASQRIVRVLADRYR
ncbi:MAG: UDP-N-acetylglucosamine 2-epimerase (non-hydrolyzing) [Desulfohalobiaceae bacterium]|nr:UDP-N-acetylglucosamine 2-epimerase (non-hydrolyzing) [Desulfohalobiaceae bacterium]